MARKLTKRFLSYTLAKHQKSTGEKLVDVMNIGDMDITRIAKLIELGNPNCSEEESYGLLDDYLASDSEHTIVSAYMDLLDEFDRDMKLFQECGISVDDMKKDFKASIETSGAKMKEGLQEVNLEE